MKPTAVGVRGSISPVTDEELVALARDGDTDAFDQLVVRHQAAVYRAALTALRNTTEAEDVTQDTFVRAWTRLSQFRGDASFKTWVLTIAWRRAATRRRATFTWWRRTVDSDDASRPFELAAADRLPDQLVFERELRGLVATAIGRLSPTLRDALLLANTGSYDYREIAEMLRIPEGTLKWRVSEARRKVRAMLLEMGAVNEQ